MDKKVVVGVFIMREPNLPYIREVCKIGCAECCRYLVVDQNGFACAKRDPELRAVMDERVARGKMSATGDNCEGKSAPFLNGDSKVHGNN